MVGPSNVGGIVFPSLVEFVIAKYLWPRPSQPAFQRFEHPTGREEKNVNIVAHRAGAEQAELVESRVIRDFSPKVFRQNIVNSCNAPFRWDQSTRSGGSQETDREHSDNMLLRYSVMVEGLSSFVCRKIGVGYDLVDLSWDIWVAGEAETFYDS